MSASDLVAPSYELEFTRKGRLIMPLFDLICQADCCRPLATSMGLIVSVMSFASAPRVVAVDWPQWGGNHQRNMVSAERQLPSDFFPGRKIRTHLGFDPATAKNVKWIARLGTQSFSSPVIANGRVLIGTNDGDLQDPRFEPTRGGALNCFDEATGQLVWRLVTPRSDAPRNRVSRDFDDLNLGICATPCIDGDRVYLVTNRCEVLCLDLAGLQDGNCGPFIDEASYCVPHGTMPVVLGERDADIVWQFDMLTSLPVFPHDATSCSVLVDGDFVYVGTGNGVADGIVVRPDGPSLVVINKHTGKLVARDNTFISPNTFHGQWSSPSMSHVEGRSLLFYGGGDGWCYAFAAMTQDVAESGSPQSPADLREVWYFDANPHDYRFADDGEPLDYWEAAKAGRRNRHKETGEFVSPSEIIATPVCYENRVYVAIGQDPMHGASGGALSCIQAKGEGELGKSHLVWQYLGIGRSMSTVSIADGLLYVGETWGRIHCLNARTGELHWVHDVRDEIWSSTMVADGKIYVGTRRGLVILAAGAEPAVIAEISLGSAVRAVPTVANGTVYVATQKHLFAINEKGEMPASEAKPLPQHHEAE